MSQNGTDEKGREHPRPWIKTVHRSGITIKDAEGAAVLLLPFTGLASRDRKMRAAEMILRAVNRPPDRGDPAGEGFRVRARTIPTPPR